ncbi:hypothetical protein [Intestinimonas butyriciproducens]|uniref:hypothetical protein n=1 Tax=Intestinimonas butyriciproducens TaxID=1297617 RepID=UPI00242BDCB8|nr:hypothetical protein [Intestinimonas butyriciproducens]MCI6364766.1 hypothetical protein [Intestinimonas butyriciproducens]
MDRSEGERRAAKRPKDQPESEGSRASRSRRSVTARRAVGTPQGAHAKRSFFRRGYTCEYGGSGETRGRFCIPRGRYARREN